MLLDRYLKKKMFPLTTFNGNVQQNIKCVTDTGAHGRLITALRILFGTSFYLLCWESTLLITLHFEVLLTKILSLVTSHILALLSKSVKRVRNFFK